jgi:hypothetical protein
MAAPLADKIKNLFAFCGAIVPQKANISNS